MNKNNSDYPIEEYCDECNQPFEIKDGVESSLYWRDQIFCCEECMFQYRMATEELEMGYIFTEHEDYLD